jgi:hypothetical protein
MGKEIKNTYILLLFHAHAYAQEYHNPLFEKSKKLANIFKDIQNYSFLIQTADTAHIVTWSPTCKNKRKMVQYALGFKTSLFCELII